MVVEETLLRRLPGMRGRTRVREGRDAAWATQILERGLLNDPHHEELLELLHKAEVLLGILKQVGTPTSPWDPTALC